MQEIHHFNEIFYANLIHMQYILHIG